MSLLPGTIRVGISNGQMPGNKSTFPPAYRSKSRLHYYGTLFNTIEVNSSFYKIPLAQTCAKWAIDVPGDFRFTLKLNRDITHAPNLVYDTEVVKKFMQAADGIGEKKGCLLIQFPGKITINYFGQVEKILNDVYVHDPLQQWNIAVEFRHESWYIRESSELLNEFGAAMVLHDFLKARIFTISDHASFSLVRFHGPAGNYRDSYSDEALEEKAKLVKELSAAGRDVYVYFNNTAGNAYENALVFKKKASANNNH